MSKRCKSVIVIGKNVLLLALAAWLWATLIFLQLAASGRSLEDLYTGGLPPGAREEMKRALELDQPSIVLSYWAFLRNLLGGSWGLSSSLYPREVSGLLSERLPRSLLLWGLAFLAALKLSRGFSKLFQHPRTSVAVMGRFTALGAATVPLPLLVLLLTHGLSYRLGWLPPGQTIDPMLWRHYPDASLNSVLFVVATALVLGLVLAWAVSILARSTLKLSGLWRGIAQLSAFALGAILGLLMLLGERLPLGLDLLRHLALPWATLTLYGGTWHALLLRSDFWSLQNGKLGAWAIFLALTLALLLAIEATYYWLGLGPLLSRARIMADFPLLLGLSFTLVGLFLGGLFALKAGLELSPARRQAAFSISSPASTQRLFPRTALKLSLLALLVLGLAALLPPPYDPAHGVDTRVPPPAPPSLEHPLGTDQDGRDVLSELMAWARSTLLSIGPAGLGAAALGLVWSLLVALLRARGRAWTALAAQVLAALAYAPLLLSFSFTQLSVILQLRLPPWASGALLSLPWAFRALAPMSSSLSQSWTGKISWYRRAAKLGAAICVGTGAAALGMALRLPQGVVLSSWLVQDPLRHWWLFWPEMLMLWLPTLSLFMLGWALRMRAEDERGKASRV